MSNSNVLSVKDYADSWLKMLKIQDQTFGIITKLSVNVHCPIVMCFL